MACALLAGCHGHNENEGVQTVSINMSERKSLPIDTDRLIPLEVTDSSAIYEVWFLEEIDGKFFTGSRSLSKIFDASSGKYIGNLSVKGEGPGEYLSLSQLWLDQDTLRIYDSTAKRLLSYLPSGAFVSSLQVSSVPNEDTNSQPIYLIRSPYGDGGYFSANCWWGGTVPKNPKYSLLDRNLNIVADIPGRETNDGSFAPDMMTIDEKNQRILAWDQLRDTIFSVSADGVKPVFAINFGDNAFPAEDQAIPSFYDRSQKFLGDSHPVYASVMKHVQTKGDELYFSFMESTDKAYLAKFNMKTGKAQAYELTSDDGRYTQQLFFKLQGDTLFVTLKDQELVEANPAIYKLPLSELD